MNLFQQDFIAFNNDQQLAYEIHNGDEKTSLKLDNNKNTYYQTKNKNSENNFINHLNNAQESSSISKIKNFFIDFSF